MKCHRHRSDRAVCAAASGVTFGDAQLGVGAGGIWHGGYGVDHRVSIQRGCAGAWSLAEPGTSHCWVSWHGIRRGIEWRSGRVWPNTL